MFYRLDDEKNVVRCTAEVHGGEYKARGHFIKVAKDEAPEYMLSTVFLGLDMGFNQDRPVCFETCLFLEGDSEILDRYSTWNQAELMHEFYLGLVRGLLHRGKLSFDELNHVLELMRGACGKKIDHK